MRFLIILILSLIALSLNAQIIKSNAIMELNNMDFSTPCTSCSEWRYSRNTNFLYRWNGTSWIIYNPGSTLNLGLSMPGIFNVSPSTLTGSGTFNVTLNSQAQNTFLAAPSNASGVPSFRTLTPSDLSVAGGLSGTSSAGRVAFYTGTSTLTGDANLTWDNSDKSLSLGGSGVSSSLLTLNSTTRGILIPRMTTTEKNAIVAPATGLLVYDLTLGAFNVYNGSAWVSVGGGLPAGSNGQIQFNNNNVFGASSDLYWDNTNNRLGIGTNLTGSSKVTIQGVGATSANSALSVLNSNAASLLHVRNDGAVGVGTNNPSSRLHVLGQLTVTGAGATSATSSLTIQNSTPTTILQVLDNGRINQIIPSSSNSAVFGFNNAVGNFTGGNNSFFGAYSGQSTSTGGANSFFGAYAGQANTTGGSNTYAGASAGLSATGSNNTYIGSSAANSNGAGSSNVAVGSNAGRFVNAGTTVTNFSSSVLIGDDARVNDNNQTNQIVIGQASRGLGTNTTVLGNSSTVQTWLGGSVTVGTTSIGARLSVRGSGSDNNAFSILATNSLARTLFSVRNDGLAQLGRNTAVTTQEVAQIEVVSDDTNTGLVITPKGTGAFIVGPAPDGGTAGGNSRGINSIDFQLARTANTQIAATNYSFLGPTSNSGITGNVLAVHSAIVNGNANSINNSGYSFIGSGQSNSINTGQNPAYATIVGGQTNTTTGVHSFIGGGQLNDIQSSLATVVGGRNNDIQFSSGYAFIGAGENNTINGSTYGTIGGGEGNVINNPAVGSTISGGIRGRAYLYGQDSYASGMFSVSGDAQTSSLRLRRQVTGFSTRTLSLNGTDTTTNFIPILTAVSGNTSRVWNARLQCVAVTNIQGTGGPVEGSVFSETMDITIKRIGTVTSIVNGTPMQSVSVSDVGMSGADFLVDADDTNESLRVRFQPPTIAAADTQIRAVCTVYLTEIGY